MYHPLCLVEVGKSCAAIPGKVISYNLKDKALKVLCDLCPDKKFCAGAFKKFNTFQFMETFACIYM